MITEILGTGRQHRKSAAEIMQILGMSKRDFHRQIRKERREGNIIISDKTSGGYWVWDGLDYEELRKFYMMERTGAIDILSTLTHVRHILKENGGNL